ncbi:MAG: DUF2497 domain-containing protein [Methylovirgula sp.]|jgi:cell pole-organizing protein PopZ
MNAPNPLSDKRSAERKAYEPSMDEILASIRRIIADDQAFSQRKPPPLPTPPRPVAEPRGRIEPTIRPSAARPSPQVRVPYGEKKLAPRSGSVSYPVEAQFHTFKATVAPQPMPIEEPDLGDFPRNSSGEDETAWSEQADNYAEEESDLEIPLVSPQTDAAVASSFGALAAAQAMPSDEQLDEIVREMIRPLLKAWLDDNLPVLVERLVRAEIERVARGGR